MGVLEFFLIWEKIWAVCAEAFPHGIQVGFMHKEGMPLIQTFHDFWTPIQLYKAIQHASTVVPNKFPGQPVRMNASIAFARYGNNGKHPDDAGEVQNVKPSDKEYPARVMR